MSSAIDGQQQTATNGTAITSDGPQTIKSEASDKMSSIARKTSQGINKVESKLPVAGDSPAETVDKVGEAVKKHGEVTSANKSPGLANGEPKPRSESIPSTKTVSKPKETKASESVDEAKVARKQNSGINKLLEKKQPEPDFVGWKQVGGWDDRQQLSQDEVDDLLSRSTVLENYIKDKYFGDWYHNTALIVITGFFSWLVARLGGGIAWLSVVLAFTATVYRTSIRRLRRNVRDDVSRELALKKLETDSETMEWLNTFLVKFWLIYEPELSKTVITIGNQVLADATPGFIESLSLDTFTLGTKAPRIESVRTFPRTSEDVAVMDWKFSFLPNDTEDLTARQLKSKVNPKVVLGVRVGKGIVSKSLPILVEDMAFSGLMRVRIKMMTQFPHIQTVDVSFLEPPHIDFVLKPIGGETFGFDINIIPGLSGFIKEMVDANMGPMLYAPNAFQLNVEQMLAGAGIDSAIGVLAVHVRNAKSLKGSDAFGNTIDPYIKFQIGNNEDEKARSSIKKDTINPTWNETHYILINNLNDTLTLRLFDFNERRKDKEIGMVMFPLETLTSKPDQENISSEVLAGGKNKGGLLFDAHWSPVLEPKTLPDGTLEPPPESKSGILKVTIHQAKDLDATKSLVGQLSPYGDVFIDNKSVSQTKVIKRNNNPIWDQSHELLIANKTKTRFSVLIRDSRGMATDPEVGKFSVPLTQLLDNTTSGNDWYDLSPRGKVRLSAVWKPVAISDIGGSAYTEPIGVVRIHVQRAEGLRNLEHIGKIDPYLRIFAGGFAKVRTATVENTLDPVFDEVHYVPIQSPTTNLSFEAMDVENVGQDRTLGSFSVDLSKYVKFEGNKYVEHKSDSVSTGTFTMAKKSPKGTLYYNIQFFPAMNVLDPDTAKERKEAEAEAAKAEAESGEKKEDKGKEAEEEDEDDEEDEEGKTSIEAVGEVEEVELALEDQVKYEHGVFALTVEDVTGAPQSYLRVSYDGSFGPSFVSPKIKNRVQKIQEASDFFIREMEYSQAEIALTASEYGTKEDDYLYRLSLPTLKLFQESYEAPKKLILTNSSGGKVQVTVRSRYFPVEFELPSRDSINNQGILEVDVLDAANIEAADRSGKSDPFAVFKYNGIEAYKTETVKKTLNPVWNEHFQTSIPSRETGKFTVDLFDWDMGPGGDDFLGTATFDLAQLEPLEPTVLSAPFEGHRGEIRCKFYFKPGFVRSATRSKTGLLDGGAVAVPGKVLSSAGAVPVKVVGGIGGGAIKGAKGLKHKVFGGGSKDKEANNANASFDPDSSFASNASYAESSNGHKRAGSVSSTTSSANGNSESVVGGITVMGLSGIEGSNIVIRGRLHVKGKRDKDVYKSKSVKADGGSVTIDDNFPFRATIAAGATMIFQVSEHHSLGKDKTLGEGVIPIGQGSGMQQVDLGNGAQLAVKVELT